MEKNTVIFRLEFNFTYLLLSPGFLNENCWRYCYRLHSSILLSVLISPKLLDEIQLDSLGDLLTQLMLHH